MLSSGLTNPAVDFGDKVIYSAITMRKEDKFFTRSEKKGLFSGCASQQFIMIINLKVQ